MNNIKKQSEQMEKQKLNKKDLEQIIGGWFAVDPPKPSDEPIIIL